MSKKVKKLVLKNYFLLGNPERNIKSLQAWLSDRMLHGKQSRNRTRFLRLMSDRLQEMDEERQRILKEHSVKKEKKLVFLDSEGKETTDEKKGKRYKIKDPKAYQKEYLEYINEDYVIDVTPSTKDAVYGVRDIILETQDEFSGIMAARYAEWCDGFESIS